MHKLERNFLWLAAANLVSSLFNILIFIYLARILELESFGYLSYALTLVFFLFNFIDLGLSTFGTREVAKEGSKAPEFVSNIISFRLIVALIIFAGFSLVILLSNYAMPIKILMAEVALMLFTASLATEWAFQGLEKMHMVFISMAVTAFLQFCLTLLFVKGPQDLLKAPIATFVGSLPIIIAYLRRLKFKLKISDLDFGHIRLYLASAMVIWAISVCAQAYNGLDIVMLGLFRGAGEVGCFTIARRVTGGAGLLMIFLANAILPHMSATYNRKEAREFDMATRKFLHMSVAIIALVFIPIIIFSDQLISMTVGAGYIAASLPLKMMMFGLIIVMFNMPYSTGLVAAGFEKDVLRQAFASAALSIFSNFILMPKYGMIGASISFILAEVVALIWILIVYKNKMKRV